MLNCSVPKKLNLLVHPVFLLGLVVLILNDHILKQQYHNAITGKLSDFAGLFIFPLFWAALFPKISKVVYVGTALIFIYWKSTWSQPFLDWLLVQHIPVTRVVDYADLVALSVLPLSYRFFNNAQLSNGRHILVTPIAVISFIAFCATSPPYWYHRKPAGVQYTYQKQFKTRYTREQLFAKMDSLGFNYFIDTAYSIWTLTTVDSLNYKSQTDTNSVLEFFRINNIVYNQDTLRELYLGYAKGRKKNYIEVYGYRVDDSSNWYADYKKYKDLMKVYKRLINEGVIEKIHE